MSRTAFNVIIIGSGPAGSLLAWILASRGQRVAMVDRQTHPRFAIGESSTPIADAALLRIADRYHLPALAPLARWGTWQDDLSELRGGKKRGFSYFFHQQHEPRGNHATDRLLVAASADDRTSDTHWYRADVDQFLFQQARHAGAVAWEATEVDKVERHQDWHVEVCDATKQRYRLTAEFLVDASGAGRVLAHRLRLPDATSRLWTRTQVTYTHLQKVLPWTEVLRQNRVATEAYPFDADDAAQHHLLRDGWLWVIRFQHGVTSIGWTRTVKRTRQRPASTVHDLETFLCAAGIEPGTMLHRMFDSATLANTPGQFVFRERLQHFVADIAGDGFALLPTTAATLDPLHSTGLAHAITGAERLADALLLPKSGRNDALRAYAGQVEAEIRLLDRLLSTAYATMHDTERFTMALMLYFAVAIRFEEAKDAEYWRRQAVWGADDPVVRRVVSESCQRLRQAVSLHTTSRLQWWSEFQHALRQLTTVPLLCPEVNGLYAYTVAEKGGGAKRL